jgi:hypothetical protein
MKRMDSLYRILVPPPLYGSCFKMILKIKIKKRSESRPPTLYGSKPSDQTMQDTCAANVKHKVKTFWPDGRNMTSLIAGI